MTSAVVLALLGATPYAQPFWERDLSALVGQLAERPRSAAEKTFHPYFEDVVRLVTCEKLPPIQENAPLLVPRLLLRAEELRRSRLGEAAATSDTVWKEILDPGFFTRKDPTLGDDETLVWPVEAEVWPHERVYGNLLPSQCPNPIASGEDELNVLTPALFARFPTKPGSDTVWLRNRLAYQRTVRLYANGEKEEARAAAGLVSPAGLEPSRQSWAKLLRLELELDSPEGYLALVDVPELAPYRLRIASKASAHLASAKRYPELLALADKVLGDKVPLTPANEDAALVRDLVYRKALALRHTGAKDKLFALVKDAFPAWSQLNDPQVEALRDVASDQLARDRVDEAGLAMFRTLAPPQAMPKRLSALGLRALEVGNLSNALQIAAVLLSDPTPRVRARGSALQAEIAIVRGDATELARAVSVIFAERKSKEAGYRDRDEMDRVTFELCQALVSRSAMAPELWTRPVRKQLELAQEVVHSRYRKNFEPLFAALDERPATARLKGRKLEAYVAVGEVDIDPPLSSIAVPAASKIEFPELYSLLAIPTARGEVKDWFPVELRRVPSATATIDLSGVSDAR